MKEFIKDTAVRALLTFCEAMLGFITVGSAINQINWGLALSVSAVALVATVLKQLVVYLQTQKNEKFEEEDISSNYSLAELIEEDKEV